MKFWGVWRGKELIGSLTVKHFKLHVNTVSFSFVFSLIDISENGIRVLNVSVLAA